MKLLLIIGCSLLNIVAYTQNQPVPLWQAIEFIKTVNIKGPTICPDKYGNTYMLTNQTNSSPFGGIRLVKYDTLGNILWKQTSQPGIIGLFYGSFTVDSLGNSFVSLCYDGGLPDYDADAVMIKYASDGTKLWEVNYGLENIGDSYVYFSELDSASGNLITLGMNLHESVPDENFLFVQSIDTSDGSAVWKTKMPGVFRPQNMRIQTDHIQILATHYLPNGKYYMNSLLGFDGSLLVQYEKPYFGYEVDFNHISKTGDVIFGNRAFGYTVTRVDIKGDTLWRYEYPSSSEKNWVRGILEDDSMNVYATGAVEIPGLSTEMTTSRINSFGGLDWQNIFHSSDLNFGDSGNDISLWSNKVVVSGGTQLQSSDVVGAIKIYSLLNGTEDYYITIGENNIFTIDRSFVVDNNLFYAGEGFQINLNNMVVATGSFHFPKISYVNIPYYPTINCYPNPTYDYINISQVDLKTFDKIFLYDNIGKLVLFKYIANENIRISLSVLPPGTYLISIMGEKFQINKKIVKIQ